MRRWAAIVGKQAFVAAPLVDASDAAFRLLAREHGAQLAYTPMLNARLMADEPPYVRRHLDPGGDADRPLAAQVCGHDERHLLAAAKTVEEAGVDAIDFNLGCPQDIARRGRYGAFLLEEEPALALRCVESLARSTELPVTAKIRLQATREQTLDVARRLQDSGIGALTVHARTRTQLHLAGGVGAADWDVLRDVVSALEIPVIANGGVRTRATASGRRRAAWRTSTRTRSPHAISSSVGRRPPHARASAT
jgi:tRNA-dihydrouridine synthase 1